MANTITAPQASMNREAIDKYRLLDELEIGRPGSVFTAEEPHSRRQVTIRLLAVEPARRASFLAESRRLMQLEHEHIAALLDAGEAQGECFLVTELLKGEALKDRLKREHCLPLKEALRIAREIASGLAFAHAHGLLHRDLCPANVWMEPSGRIRLLGLGAYAGAEQDSLLDRLAESGTPGYMSPEQAAGEEIGPASDLFSLGCILYQMTTGERPFRGDRSTALIRAVVFEHPTAARHVNPEIPEALDDLVTRLLAKMPADRPMSAQEVENRLTEWLDPMAPKPRPTKIPDALIYPASRRILDTLENLKNPTPNAPVVNKTVTPAAVEPAKTTRSWAGDVVAAVLLVAGAIGLYLWWKASNVPPPASPAIERPAK